MTFCKRDQILKKIISLVRVPHSLQVEESELLNWWREQESNYDLDISKSKGMLKYPETY